jgi:hypothetical protein
MSTDAEFMAKEIGKKLVGGTIKEAFTAKNEGGFDDEQSFGFMVQKGKKLYRVWVDRDAEGNGCGWLAIEAQENPNIPPR